MSRPKITANQIAATGSVAGQVPTSDGTNVSWATPSGGAKINAIPGGAGQVVNRTYVSPGDTNGVFYYVGTNFGIDAWSNPSGTTAGKLFVQQSNGNPTLPDLNTTDRTSSNETTGPSGSGLRWYAVDLGTGRSLAVSRYLLRACAGIPVGSSMAFRNWKLQGTNVTPASMAPVDLDAVTWIDLDVRAGDTTMGAVADSWADYGPNQAASSVSYRYFRLLQTGVNASGSTDFGLSEWELYGAFTFAGDPLADGRLIQVDGPTGLQVRQTRWTATGGEMSCSSAPVFTTTEPNGNVTLLPIGTGTASVTRLRQALSTPASSTATGVVGQMVWDANFVYVCTATNT
jgi:hypothetical protein